MKRESAARRSVLAVLPRRAPRGAARFLRALARGGRPVRVVAAGSEDPIAFAARAALARGDCAAVVVVDAPGTRAATALLAGYSPCPVVLVQLACEAPRAEEGFLAPRRSREAAAKGLSAATEVWSFRKRGRPSPFWTRARPRALVERERFEPAWIEKRLDALIAERAPALEQGLSSIIIPCWNNLKDTRACLRALSECTDVPYEVIVVDNGSDDGTADWVRRHARARLIRNASNLGFARAVNQGMRAARGRWLVWLNNDVLVTPGWLGRLVKAAARAPWIGAVGPCTNETVGPQKVERVPYADAAGRVPFSEAWAMKNGERVLGVHRLTGFCVLLKREAYEQVGGLDERFGRGTYEEYDYCLRLRQAGWDLAVAEGCYVHHHGSRSFPSRRDMERQAAANRDLFVDKWCRRALEFLDEINPELSRR